MSHFIIVQNVVIQSVAFYCYAGRRYAECIGASKSVRLIKVLAGFNLVSVSFFRYKSVANFIQ